MKKLHFTYDMQIDYTSAVLDCNYTIKCIPVNTCRQSIENTKISLTPNSVYNMGSDGFKNVYIWGKNTEPHMSFAFSISGDVSSGLSDYESEEDVDLDGIFAYPHGLNVAGNSIEKFYDNKIQNLDTCTYDKVVRITELLFNEFKYQKGSTSVNTTAEEAFAQGYGVCQDYAHILISLLHQAKISARYVTGFIIGEGESHAWVEFLDGGKWYGIDPTNNKLVGEDYIKIGHGRDAKDCLINRGIVRGGGAQKQTIAVKVSEV